MPVEEGAIADAVDQARNAFRGVVDEIERGLRELHAIARASGDGKPVRHIAADTFASQRLQLARRGHALRDLLHLGQLEARAQFGLADQHDLQETPPGFEL